MCRRFIRSPSRVHSSDKRVPTQIGIAVTLGRFWAILLVLALPFIQGWYLPPVALATWGKYKLVGQAVHEGIFGKTDYLTIFDGKTIVWRLKAYQIEEPVRIGLTRGEYEDLRIDYYAASPGAHCCVDSVILSINSGKVEELFSYYAGDYDLWLQEIRDYDGDGRNDILAASSVLSYFGDMSFAGSPAVYLVIGSNGKTWSDKTKASPKPVRRLAFENRQELEATLKKGPAGNPWFEEQVFSYAIGYLANDMASAGKGDLAIEWLRNKLPSASFARARGALPELRRAISRLPGLVKSSRHSRHQVLKVSTAKGLSGKIGCTVTP